MEVDYPRNGARWEKREKVRGNSQLFIPFGMLISFAHLLSGEKMKRAIKVIISVAMLVGFMQPTFAAPSDKPILVSFTMTPDTVDTSSSNSVVTLTLTVSNPTGIADGQTQATLTDGGNSTLVTSLIRTDSPVKTSLATVVYKGTITIPANFPAGAYWATANPVSSLNSNGSIGYPSSQFSAVTTSKVVGAEDALLVRSAGNLNYNYATFKGPAYDKTLGITFLNPKFSIASSPIWKVGESFNINDYFELTVSSLPLRVKANTPTVCTSSNSILQLIAVGSCSYTVYTDRTSDYQYQGIDQVVTITGARTKPTYAVGTIATQSSELLPLSIPGPVIYSPLGLILPVSTTPSVCSGSGTYVNVISGGTCTLNYSSPASSDYLASDVYPLTFEISRTSQTISFSAPSVAKLTTKSLTLSATASSGQPVIYISSSPATCSVTGNSLNLLAAGICQIRASQLGSTKIAPASVDQTIVITGAPTTLKTVSKVNSKVIKKLVCVKNGKKKTVTSKKCPSGYSPKK